MVKFKTKSRDGVVVLAFSLLISTTLALQGNWTLDKFEAAQLLYSPPTRLHELYSATTGTNKPHNFDLEPVPVSDECLYAVRDVLAGNYTNALLMFLYSGKAPGEYGNYLECRELDNAHFCNILYPVNNVTTVLASSGICMPSVCTEQELTWALKKFPNPSWLPLFGEAKAECVPKKRPSLSPGGVGTVIAIAILSGFVVLATLMDLWRRYTLQPERPLASPQVTRGQYVEELRSGALLPSLLSGKRTIGPISSINSSAHDSATDSSMEHDSPHHMDDTTNGNTTSLEAEARRHLEASHGEDAKVEPPKQMWMRILFCFSIAENMERLAKHFPNNKTNLNPLNSLRVLAMMWVVLGHTCLFTIFIGWTNPGEALRRLFPTPSFQILLNATLSVDVFFYLTGFLMAYFTLKELRQRKGKVSWIILVVHRVWRMTPTMVLALFFCWTVAPSLGNGPWWRTFMTWTTQACKKYWWTNLLYINNFWNFDLDQTCLAWSWYMSADMQFFLVAIPLVYVLYRWPKIGFAVLGVLSVASIAFIIGISITHHLSPLVIHMDDGYRKYLYTKPWARFSTFAIGIVGAYLLLAHEERVNQPHGFRKLPFIPQSVLVAVAWVVGAVLTLAPLFGTYSAYQPNAKAWSTAQNTAFLALSRPSFTLGLAIMAHLIMTSRASVSLKDALSHPIWTPFARLTFGAYLYHPIIMFGYYFSSLRPIEFTGVTIFQNWLSFTVLAFVASLISFLIIERPTENLESLLIDFLKQRAKKRKQSTNHSKNLDLEQQKPLISEDTTNQEED